MNLLHCLESDHKLLISFQFRVGGGGGDFLLLSLPHPSPVNKSLCLNVTIGYYRVVTLILLYPFSPQRIPFEVSVRSRQSTT